MTGGSRGLSVVVPSVNGWSDLSDCLRALMAAGRDVPLEVLVVDRLGDAVRDRIRTEFPSVRILPAPPGTTIPALRAMAFEAATADAVAVIEDHVLVPPGWAKALLAALAAGEDVIGGGVENAATETVVDWAAFLCEYSQLIPPLPSGPVAALTGNNTAYRRSVLQRYRSVWSAGGWENRLHDALRRDGIPLYQHPEIVVGHKMHYSIPGYLEQRYLYARAWAGDRVAGGSPLRRLGFGSAALLLPTLL
ncbi:MAG TPA: glycosyltransferase, partial [Gemmatimonadales bacterium]|nr:glycosyltransferase [Gemmatimonadales bacterium]